MKKLVLTLALLTCVSVFAQSSASNYDNNSPKAYKLYQSFPAGNLITFNFDLPVSSNARLVLTNDVNKEITVVINTDLEAGRYEINFDASSLTSGTYYYQLETANFTDSKKIVLN
jgi:hypothetical protein